MITIPPQTKRTLITDYPVYHWVKEVTVPYLWRDKKMFLLTAKRISSASRKNNKKNNQSNSKLYLNLTYISDLILCYSHYNIRILQIILRWKLKSHFLHTTISESKATFLILQ